MPRPHTPKFQAVRLRIVTGMQKGAVAFRCAGKDMAPRSSKILQSRHCEADLRKGSQRRRGAGSGEEVACGGFQFRTARADERTNFDATLLVKIVLEA